MKVTDAQLDEYIILYKTSYGVELERTEALDQVNKLITLVLYAAFPEHEVNTLEESINDEYNEGIVSRPLI